MAFVFKVPLFFMLLIQNFSCSRMFQSELDTILLPPYFFTQNVTRFSCYKSVSPKTWRVFPVTCLFCRKRDTFLLLHVCFAENVTRFCRYMFVLLKTWRVFAVTSLFRRKRDTFLPFQVCFIENVTRFCCYKIFQRKRGKFYPIQRSKDVIRHILLIFNWKIK